MHMRLLICEVSICLAHLFRKGGPFSLGEGILLVMSGPTSILQAHSNQRRYFAYTSGSARAAASPKMSMEVKYNLCMHDWGQALLDQGCHFLG